MGVEITYQRGADPATGVDQAWLEGARRGLFWLTLALAGVLIVNSFGLYGLIYYRLHIEVAGQMFPFDEPSPMPVVVLGALRTFVLANVLLAALAWVRREPGRQGLPAGGADGAVLLMRLSSFGAVVSSLSVLLFAVRVDTSDPLATALSRAVWGLLTLTQSGIVLGLGLYAGRVAKRIMAHRTAKRVCGSAMLAALTLAADSWLQGGVTYEPGDSQGWLGWLQPATWYLNVAGATLLLVLLLDVRRLAGRAAMSAVDTPWNAEK
jgi:hypothetical protein